MIALKLVFQSLACVGSVIVCAGGGYYVMREGNEDNFYLVSSDSAASSGTPTTELWTVPETKPKPSSATVSTILTTKPVEKETKTQKNYKCLNSETNDTQADESCYHYSLAPTTTSKAINISDIQTFIKDTSVTSTLITKTETKSTITANKFFLLKSKTQLHTDWTFDGTKTIKLVEKTATNADASKTYATFKLHAKISSSEVEGQTSFAIVKYIELSTATLTSSTTDKTYKCSFIEPATAESKKACFISAIGTLTSPQTIKDLTFSSATIPSTQGVTTFTKDHYYLVKWTTDKFEFSFLKEKTLFFVEETTESATTKLAKFSIESPAFIQPPTTGTITEAIIIK